MTKVTRKGAGEKLVEYLQGEFHSQDWEFEIADALETFGAEYEKFSGLRANSNVQLCTLWHKYFVHSLRKIARDLPPNNIDDLTEAVDKLTREDLEATAKRYGARVIFPPKSGMCSSSKRPASEVQAEDEVSGSGKRAKHETDKDNNGFTFKTDGAYAVRITDDANFSSKLNFNGHGPVTVTVYEKDTTQSAPASGSKSSRGGNGVKVEVPA